MENFFKLSPKIIYIILVISALLFFGELIKAHQAEITVNPLSPAKGFEPFPVRAQMGMDINPLREVPILLYHHIGEGADLNATISESMFKAHMEAIDAAGYNVISLARVIEFVEKGRLLPENPVVLTFDDGYLSNYEIAYPILKELKMPATIFVIGESFGNRSNYKRTDFSIIPHFGKDEALNMLESGIITIGSHSFDMHQWGPFENGPARENMLKLSDEADDEYLRALKEDFLKESLLLFDLTGEPVTLHAYPGGMYSARSEVFLQNMGVALTVSTERGHNVVEKGMPSGLFAMKRYNIAGDVSPLELLQILEKYPL